MKYRISFVYNPDMGIMPWTGDSPEDAVKAFLAFANRTVYRVDEIDGDGQWEIDAQELD